MMHNGGCNAEEISGHRGHKTKPESAALAKPRAISAVQNQKAVAVTAPFSSKQSLLFGFADQNAGFRYRACMTVGHH